MASTSNEPLTTSERILLPSIWLLIGISAIGPIAMNGVLPANTAIMAELETEYGTVQLVLTVYLLASLVGQVVLGNLADQLGRRPIMIFSLAIFAVGGFLCAASNSIETLLAARFIQGIGASACTYLPRTIVRDVYARDKAASVMGYMTTAMMIAPMFGPAIGGFTTDHYSWRWLYFGLGSIGVFFCIASFLFQHETMAARKAGVAKITLLKAGGILFKERAFVSSALTLSGAVGGYFCFLAGAPFVVMESRGYSPSVYGAWFAMVAVGYLSGNFCAGKFSAQFGTRKMIRISMVPGLISVCLFWVLSGWSHPLGLFIPMMFLAFSNGLGIPNINSAAMSVRTDLMSSASGLAGALHLGFGVLITYAMSRFLPFGDYWLYVFITFATAVWLYGIWLDPVEE